MTEPHTTSWILHHLGEDNLPMKAVSPPIFQTSIFCFNSFEELQAAIADEKAHYMYSRGNNPTVNIVEQKLAALEKAEQAKLLSSGVSAISAAIMAFVSTGDHVVCVNDSYIWARRLLESYLKRFGVEHTFADGTRLEAIEAAIRPNTRLIYLESPTTLTFKLQDLRAIASLAKARGIKTVIDNTWSTPIFCNPIELGIDLVVHSASKYLGGHSDVVAGVVAGTKKDIEHIFDTEFLQLGTVPDPMMAWLVLRGLRTLAVRMPVHFANALHVTRYLESHPAVESVIYPFLPSHPQHALATQQMRGGGSLFSLRLKTRDIEKVKLFVNSLAMFKRAVSWGGYESLIFPDAAHYTGKPPEDRVSLIRLHIGLEEKEAVVADLDQALARIR
jgi:cystathionine beta-lyase